MDGLTSFLPVSLLISNIYKPLTLMVNEFMNTLSSDSSNMKVTSWKTERFRVLAVSRQTLYDAKTLRV